MAASEDTDLVRHAIAGDRRALEALWVDGRRWVAVALLSGGARAADLPDLLQETACAMTRGIASLRDPRAFRAWLRQLALHALRSTQRRRTPSLLEAEPCSPDGVVGADEETRALAAALAALPDAYREPLLLKSIEGLSQRAVAAMLGLPETTVETRLARARRLLRLALQRRGSVDTECARRRET